ncbi:MAG TPA: hypothetical protein VFC85_06640 [Verrucomicrobiae bacterium]|nr:hypothetical protein [Verrucomicrobiae bacterium]
MKLKNFSISNEAYANEISAFEQLWDLHNIASFDGFQQDFQQDTFELNWHIDPEYASQKYPANSFAILFRDVKFLEITPRDSDMPKLEDICLSSVSGVLPNEKLARNPDTIEGQEFHLLFKFQSELTIRVGAKSAEFILRDSP